jgi:hypothetical protein
MGLFDDAIREHLELKRQTGADEEELKELEDEAFGLPARPGDPDFPGTSEEEAVAEPSAAGGVYDAETDEASVGAPDPPEGSPVETAEEDPHVEAPTVPIAESPSAAPEEAPAALEEPVVEPAGEETDEPVAQPEFDLEADEQSAAPAELEDSTFTTAEREAIAEQPTVFFEQQEPAELELGDLDLDLDEEIEEVGGSVSEPLEGEAAIVEEEPAVEEVPAPPDAPEPPHVAEPEPAPPAAEPPAEADGPSQPVTDDFKVAEDAEPASGDEDVLEETPEFLRENPDDDELWFEQGEPKDFDF